MIVVAMRDSDSIDFKILDTPKIWHGCQALELGVDTRVQQDAVTIHLHHPPAGPDAIGWIEINEIHVLGKAGRVSRGHGSPPNQGQTTHT